MIEKAHSTDIPKIIGFYKKALDEMGIDYLESLVSKTVTDSFFIAPCFLLKIDGIIRGITGMTITYSPWSGNATLSDYIFYIEPEYRDKDNLGGLVKNCKEFADEIGVPLQVNFVVNDDEELRKRVLRKYGFKVASVVGKYND